MLTWTESSYLWVAHAQSKDHWRSASLIWSPTQASWWVELEFIDLDFLVESNLSRNFNTRSSSSRVSIISYVNGVKLNLKFGITSTWLNLITPLLICTWRIRLETKECWAKKFMFDFWIHKFIPLSYDNRIKEKTIDEILTWESKT